jgi:hypothetical protein
MLIFFLVFVVAIFILCLLCASGDRMFFRRTYFGFLRYQDPCQVSRNLIE